MPHSLKNLYTPLTLILSTSSFGLSLISANSFEKYLQSPSQFTFIVALVYFGALFSNFFIRTIKKTDKRKLQLSNILFILGYSLPFLENKFNLIAASRFIIGMASGIVNSIVPNYIYNSTLESDNDVNNGNSFNDNNNNNGNSFNESNNTSNNINSNTFINNTINNTSNNITINTSINNINNTSNISNSNNNNMAFTVFMTTLNTAGCSLGVVFGHFLNLYFNPFSILKIIIIFTFLHFILLFFIKENSKNQSHIFNNSKNINSLFVSFLLHLTQHLSGINFIVIFTSRLFSSDPLAPLKYNLIAVFVVVFSCYFLCIFNKKNILILSLITVIFSLISIKFSRFFIILYFIGFNLGLSSIPWTSFNDLFDESSVEFGSWFGTSINYIAGFLMIYFISIIDDVLKEYHLYFYVISTGIATILLMFMYKPIKTI